MMLVLAFVVFLVFMADFTLYRRKKRSFMLSVDIKYIVIDIVSIVIVFLY